MSLGCKLLMVSAFGWSAFGASLRVCADPNNLPFSDRNRQGFENQLAQLTARELGLTVEYFWAPQRGDWLARTLNAGVCDVVMGISTQAGDLRTTLPYYRSTYVFVFPRDRRLEIHSFDDPSLKTARIGIHVLQNEDATAPPAQALIRRGLLRNIRWYKLYPDFTRRNPPSALIEAVERRDVDVAVAWGPLAGYFAKQSPILLEIAPVMQKVEAAIPLAFDISMGVRHGDTRLLSRLNTIIRADRPEIRAILTRYGVPLDTGLDRPVSLKR